MSDCTHFKCAEGKAVQLRWTDLFLCREYTCLIPSAKGASNRVKDLPQVSVITRDYPIDFSLSLSLGTF